MLMLSGDELTNEHQTLYKRLVRVIHTNARQSDMSLQEALSIVSTLAGYLIAQSNDIENSRVLAHANIDNGILDGSSKRLTRQ